jgi:drug/metabolite transporter (DMT)-like permease
MPLPGLSHLDPTSAAQWGLNGLVLICLACWGIWGIFDKKALHVASNRDVLFAMLVCQLPQVPLCWMMLNHFHPGWQVSGPLIYYCALGAIVYVISMVSYVTAMSRAEAGFVLGFTAGYPLVAQVLAVFLLGEKLVPGLMLGGLLIAAGVFSVGLTGEKHSEPKEPQLSDRELLLANLQRASADEPFPFSAPAAKPGSVAVLERPVQTELTARTIAIPAKPTESRFSPFIVPVCVVLATLTWGIKGLFDKIAVGMAPPLVVYFVELVLNLTTLIPFCLYFLISKKRPQLQARDAWVFTGLSTITLAIGGWSYLAALGMASASYVITITGCYPLLMYGFTIFFLKERFNATRLLGIALIVIGGICVQLTQH